MSDIEEVRKKVDAALKHRADGSKNYLIDEPKRKDRAARPDDASAKLDKVLSAIDALHSRVDELEGAAAKRGEDTDADAGGEEESASLVVTPKTLDEQERDNELKAKGIKMADDSCDEAKAGQPGGEKSFGDIQAKADAVFRASLNCAAPAPMTGETVLNYRRRLARGLQRFSSEWEKADLRRVDGVALGIAENRIYADAMDAALNPVVPNGELREVRTTDATGRTIIEFRGRPSAWMRPFTRPAMLAKFKKPARFD